MNALKRFRHQATTGKSGWAGALRGLRRAAARIEARHQAGSIEAYLDHTVRECVGFATAPKEISHLQSARIAPRSLSADARPAGQSPVDQCKSPTTQLSTMFNQLNPDEWPRS